MRRRGSIRRMLSVVLAATMIMSTAAFTQVGADEPESAPGGGPEAAAIEEPSPASDGAGDDVELMAEVDDVAEAAPPDAEDGGPGEEAPAEPGPGPEIESPAPAMSAMSAPALGGTVTIRLPDGRTAPRSGDTLTADISALTPSPEGGELGTLVYEWYSGGVEVAKGTAAPGGEPAGYPPITYSVTVADIGKAIYVTITADGEAADGSVSSAATAAAVSGSALQGKPLIGIEGNHASPIVGDTLTADLSPLYTVPPGDFGEITYYWRVAGGNVTSGVQGLVEETDGEGAGTGVYIPEPITYKVQAADVGKKIQVSIAAQYATGEMYSDATTNAVVKQPAPVKPAKPTDDASRTSSTRVTLNAMDGCEYAMVAQSGVEPAGWQDSPVFNNLTGGTTYYFYARVKETPERYASPRSDAAEITARSSGDAVIDLESETASGDGWSYAGGVYTVADKADVLVVGTASGKSIVVANGAKADISLLDASFKSLTLGVGAEVTLFISGDNELAGGAHAEADEATLSIGGSGALAANFMGGVTILGGSLNLTGTFSVQPKNSDEQDVYMNTLTVYTAVAGHQIGGLYPGAAVTAVSGALESYNFTGITTDTASKLYLWLPASSGTETLTLQLNNVPADHSASYERFTNNNTQNMEIVSDLLGYVKDSGEKYPANYSFNGVMHTVNGATPAVRIEHRSGAASPTQEIISATGSAKVTIKDVKINSPAGGAFASNNVNNTLTLEGANELSTTSGSEAVGYALTVDGEGSLYVQAPNTNSGQAAMGRNWGASGCNIVINSGVISVYGGRGGYGGGLGCGTWGYGNVTIKGGTVYAERFGVESGGTMSINGGTVTGGTVAGAGLRINGGSFNVNQNISITNSSGVRVYKNILTVGDGDSLQREKAATAATVDGVAYGVNDVKTDALGNVYFWLPDTAGEDEEVSVSVAGEEEAFKNTFPRTADNFNAETLYNTAPPPINGTVTITQPSELKPNGGALTAVASVDGSPALRYAWYRGADDTGYFAVGATAQTYTPQLADAGYRLMVRVTAVGRSGALWSEASGIVQPLPAAQNPGYNQSPAVTAIYGMALSAATVTPGGWSRAPGTDGAKLVGGVGAGISVTLQYVSAGYETVEKTVVVTVSPRPVIIRGVEAESRVYDGTSAVTVKNAAGATIVGIAGNANSGLVPGDAGRVGVSVSATGTLGSPAVGVNRVVNAAVTLTGDLAGNYTITAATVLATILKKTVTLTGAGTAEKEYDGDNTFGSDDIKLSGVTIIGNIDGANLSLSAMGVTGRLVSSDVGAGNLTLTGTFTLAGLAAANYTLSGQPTVHGEIKPSTEAKFEELGNVTAPNASGITYGQALSDSALIGGDTRGSFEWTNSSARPDAGSSQQNTTFTPNEQTIINYALPVNYTATVQVQINVAKATPGIVVSVSGGNGSITVTATLSGVGGGATPTGNIAFSHVFSSSNVDDGTVAVSGGEASKTIGGAGGQYSFTAAYVGDGNYNAISGTNSFDATRAPQSPITITNAGTVVFGTVGRQLGATGGSGIGDITFSVPPNDFFDITESGLITTKKAGGPVAVTVKKAADSGYNEATATADITITPRPLTGAVVAVSKNYPFTGSPVSPAAGDVAVALDGKALASGVDYTLGGAGTAVGTATVTITGRGNYSGTATGAFSVVKAAPTVALTLSPESGARYGDTLTLRAQVRNTQTNNAPTGSVVFKRNGTALGTIALAGGDGELSFEIETVGTFNFTAEYSGDGNYNAANSEAASYAIAKAARELTIAAATVTYGQTTQLTASPDFGETDGTVTFSADDAGNGFLTVTPDGRVTGVKAGGPAQVNASIAGGAHYVDATTSITLTVQKRETEFTASQYGGASGKTLTTHIMVEFSEQVDEFGAGSIALTGASVSGPVEHPSAGIYLVPVTLGTATGNGGAVAVTLSDTSNHAIAGASAQSVTVYKPVPIIINEDSIKIDYEARTLTGLVAGASYAITPSGLGTAETGAIPAGGTYPIPEGWLGRQLSIIRHGGANTVDSAEYPLDVPARPAAPSGISVSSELSQGNTAGTLGNLNAALRYEYRVGDADGLYTTVTAGSVSTTVTLGGAISATVYLRFKATSSAFASPAAQYVIVPPNSFDLGEDLEGYAPSQTPLTIPGADITAVAPLADFPAANSGGNWTIAPKAGLAAGEYERELIVTATVSGVTQTLRSRVHFTVHQNAVISSVTPLLNANGATDRVQIEFAHPITLSLTDIGIGALPKDTSGFKDGDAAPSTRRVYTVGTTYINLGNKTGDKIAVTVNLDSTRFAYQIAKTGNSALADSAAAISIPRRIKSAGAVTPVPGYSTSYIQFTLARTDDTPPGYAIPAAALNFPYGAGYAGPIAIASPGNVLSSANIIQVAQVDADPYGDTYNTYRVFFYPPPEQDIAAEDLKISIPSWGVADFAVSGGFDVEEKALIDAVYVLDNGGNNLKTDLEGYTPLPDINAHGGISVPPLTIPTNLEFGDGELTAVYVNGALLDSSLYQKQTGQTGVTVKIDNAARGTLTTQLELLLKDGWADPDIAADGGIYNIIALFADDKVLLAKVSVQPGTITRSYPLAVTNGTISGFSNPSRFAYGSTATITAAQPAADLEFDHWTDGIGTVSTSPAATYTMPARAATLTAIYRFALPAAAIDYEHEKLTGLLSNVTYSIGTANADGEIAITSLIGTVLTITRPAAGATLASRAQNLPIPARPAAPSNLQPKHETFTGFKDGEINGVTTAMQCSTNGTDWESIVTPGRLTGLPPATYLIRYAATAAAFSSVEAEIKIEDGETTATWIIAHDKESTESAGNVKYGYTGNQSITVTVTNTGNQPLTNAVATLDGYNASRFTITGGAIGELAPSATRTFSVAPNSGLEPNTYTAKVSIAADPKEPGRPNAASVNASFDITFTVNKADPLTAAQLDYSIPTDHVYNGAEQGIGDVTAKIAGAGDVTVRYSTTPKDAGIYTVTADIAVGARYEAANGLTLGSYTIAPKSVQPTGVTATKEYDGTNIFDNDDIEVGSAAFPGIVEGDTLVLDKTGVTGTLADANVGTGNLTVAGAFTLSGESADNYTLEQPEVTASITKADNTFTAEQVGGINGKVETTAIRITFTKPVTYFDVGSELTLTGASLHGAAVIGTQNKEWVVPITLGSGTDNGGNVSVKIGSLRNYNITGTNPVDDVKVFKPVPEEKPTEAKINYANEWIEGLVNDGQYIIRVEADDLDRTADASDGYIPIAPEWMGKSVSIIKKGGDTSVDSIAQPLPIPARPVTPTLTDIVQPTQATVTGSFMMSNYDENKTYEYRKVTDADNAWSNLTHTDGTASSIDVGAYYVRVKAGTNFHSQSTSVRFYAYNEVRFASVLQGYTSTETKAVQSTEITGLEWEVSSSTNFEIESTSSSVKLNPGLAPGDYKDVLLVHHNGNADEKQDVTVKVYKKVEIKSVTALPETGLTNQIKIEFVYPVTLAWGDVTLTGGVHKDITKIDFASTTDSKIYVIDVTPQEHHKTGDAITVSINLNSTNLSTDYAFQASKTGATVTNSEVPATVTIPREIKFKRLGQIDGYSTSYIQVELTGYPIPEDKIESAMKIEGSATITDVLPVTDSPGVYRVFLNVTANGTVKLSIPDYGVNAIEVPDIVKAADLSAATYFLDNSGNNYHTDNDGFQKLLPESDAMGEIIAPEYKLYTSVSLDDYDVESVHIRNRIGSIEQLEIDRYTVTANENSANFIFDGGAPVTITNQLIITLKEGWTGYEYGANDYEITAIFKDKSDNKLTAALGVLHVLNVTQSYDLTVTDGTGSGRYAEGTVVNITADETIESDAKVFSGWQTTDGGTIAASGSASTTYTMPSNSATVTAIYNIRPDAPIITIDYADRKLITSDAGDYIINGKKITATNSSIAIDSSWFGTTLTIRKAGIPDSKIFALYVEQIKPAPTTVTAEPETFIGFNDGKLTGVTADMEYKKSGLRYFKWVIRVSDKVPAARMSSSSYFPDLGKAEMSRARSGERMRANP